MMDSEDIIHKLIAKIDKGLPEIRVRAIATLHTKITVGLLSVELLPTFVLLPRACMNWINDNTKKSDSLFKVLVII